MSDRKELGLPMSVPDGLVAAIARLNHLAVATRDVLDFEHCGIDVLNPFEAAD
jgi:predicted nucleic acid-binding protein